MLGEYERARLATIATVVQFIKGETIYSADELAKAIFTIEAGLVKTYRRRADGSDHITAFLFPGDIVGLSEEGRYTDSAMALANTTSFRLPVVALRSRLSKDAALEFEVITKLVHDLRFAQRHAFIISNRHANEKLAMFLQMLEQLQFARDEDITEIFLPMRRADIGEYLAMTSAALSRAFHSLSRQRLIKLRGLRHVRIVDRDGFEALAGTIEPASASTRALSKKRTPPTS